MKTVKIKLYSFDELSKDAQQKVLEYFSQSSIELFDWWESTYEDAENVGLKIEDFDLDRMNINGKFVIDELSAANKIIKEHGKTCETYKTAKQYIKDVKKANDETIEDINEDFLHSLLEDYRIILQSEYEYQTGEEAAKETIEANEYLFFQDGELAHITHYVGKHEKAGITEFHFHGETVTI